MKGVHVGAQRRCPMAEKIGECTVCHKSGTPLNRRGLCSECTGKGNRVRPEDCADYVPEFYASSRERVTEPFVRPDDEAK